MNRDLEKQIIEDLEKSGFSSELRAIRTFITNSWRCTGFANYLDLDHEQIRAVDLRATSLSHGTSPISENITVEYYIEGEVKKSEKPWVVFKERIEYITDDYINNLTHISGVPPYKIKKNMPKHSLHTILGWRAYGLHESFKKPDSPSRAYSSLITVCKSAESTLEAASAYYKEIEQDTKNTNEVLKEKAVVIVKPIIILDGTLLAASLSDEGEIGVENVPFAPLEFVYRSKHCRKGIYLVDLVTLNNLAEYLDLVTQRQSAIFGGLLETNPIKD